MSEIKVSDPFKTVILSELTTRAENDPLFALTFKKENKNIDDCISYILNTVKNSGIAGFTDAEIFGMATHYYDEDNLDPGKPMKCQVIVNHTIELSPDEIQQAKQQAKEKIIFEEMQRLRKPANPSTAKKSEENNQPFLF